MAATQKTPIVVYADGSCEGNPGPGGWGVVILAPDGTRRRLSGGDSATTNNRMEITAAIEALRALDSGTPVIVRSDSQYLVKTMNDGWRRTKNRDLWEELDREAARHGGVRFEWVRGHAGDAGNEEADELAREAAAAAARTAADGPEPRRPAGARRPSRAGASNDPDEPTLDRLRPMLAAGERIAGCAACGQLFVARGDEDYCSLVGCQMKKRR